MSIGKVGNERKRKELNNNKLKMEGKIYIIYNTLDDDCYIGCTFKTVEQRLAKHKLRSKEALLQNIKLYKKAKVVGWPNMKIHELEKLSCSKLELRMLEGFYILRLKPSLNSRKTGSVSKRMERTIEKNITKSGLESIGWRTERDSSRRGESTTKIIETKLETRLEQE